MTWTSAQAVELDELVFPVSGMFTVEGPIIGMSICAWLVVHKRARSRSSSTAAAADDGQDERSAMAIVRWIFARPVLGSI